jgi:hypothetical protein
MWLSRRCCCWSSAPLASHDERGAAGPRRKPRCRGPTDRDADAVRSSAAPPPEHWTARNRAASTSASHLPSCRLGGGSDFLPSASTRSHMETSDGRGSYPSLWGRCRGGLRLPLLDGRRCFASAMPKFLIWASRVGVSRNGSRACGTPNPGLRPTLPTRAADSTSSRFNPRSSKKARFRSVHMRLPCCRKRRGTTVASIIPRRGEAKRKRNDPINPLEQFSVRTQPA